MVQVVAHDRFDQAVLLHKGRLIVLPLRAARLQLTGRPLSVRRSGFKSLG